MGPFYFAWVSPDETAFSPTHIRVDEQIMSFSVQQAEGDFAQLDISVKNPKIGLLSPGRKVWAWLSYDPNWQAGTPSDPGDVIPLFFGRLVGIPSDINKEVVTLILSARPLDFVDRKAAAAEDLKVLPFYDPIWIDPQQIANPDTVLEGYTKLWHIDRVTGEVTASDVIVGEDGLEAFTEADVPYDSVQIALNQTPLRSVTVDGKVNWTQQYQGAMRLFGKKTVDTYTGQSLLQDWPKVGASLGGGWTVIGSKAADAYDCANVKNFTWNWSWENEEKTHMTGDTMRVEGSLTMPQFNGPFLKCTLTDVSQTGILDPFGDPPINRDAKGEQTYFFVAQSKINTSLTLFYKAARGRTEHVRFALVTNVQPLVTLPDESDTKVLSLNSQDVGVATVDSAGAFSGELPIGSLARRAYFTTDRGMSSIEHLIARARAQLVIRSRAVQVSWDCSFDRAIDLTCRKEASIVDDRLPGGMAIGKVIGYTFSADGSTGAVKGNVTIGCAIGYDGAIAAVPGTPDYVDNGYVDAGYQTASGQVVVFPDSDVGYTPPTDLPNDDGLHFPLSKDAAGSEQWFNDNIDEMTGLVQATFEADKIVADLSRDTAPSIDTQQKLAAAQASSTEEVLKANPTKYVLRLSNLSGGPFNTDYDVVVTPLEIPRQINLEAVEAVGSPS